MDLPQDLLDHAINLLAVKDDSTVPKEVDMRRAISASYYALFHQINQDAANLLAPNVPLVTNYRIQRWFDHLEMKKICGRFMASKLDQPLLDLIGPSASSDLQTVVRSFVLLQEARHSADYDLSYAPTGNEAVKHLRLALEAIEAWDRIQGSAEANIFILSLLLWKNWEKER